MKQLAWKLKRKPSGGERAWKASFTGRLESEPRNKLVLIDLGCKSIGGIQGGMPLWSQGEAREGEAESPKGERWKGEVSSSSKESMGKTSGLTFQLPCQI
jgi:hypothetical protein